MELFRLCRGEISQADEKKLESIGSMQLLRNYLRDANEGIAKLAAKILIKIGDNVEDILRLSTVELTWDAVNKLCQTEAKRVRFAEESQDDSDGDSGNGTPFSRIIAFESDEDSDEDSENGEKEEEEEEGLPKENYLQLFLKHRRRKEHHQFTARVYPQAQEKILEVEVNASKSKIRKAVTTTQKRRDDENIDAQELWRECYFSKSRLSLRRLLEI